MTTKFDLDLKPTLYSEQVEQSPYVSKHHMGSNCHLYNYIGSGYLPMFLKNFVNIPDYVENEVLHIVTSNEVNRLDLIAWKYYQNPELFWVIMAVNNILNPFEIKENTVLRILPLSYIEYNLLRYSD